MQQFEYLHSQIAILHGRGLGFNDYKHAKQYLLTNNYYNIINGYSKYFIDTTTSRYVPNANFDEISHLYFFDKEIKHAFFKSITEAENHLKSILAYRFAEANPNKPYAYLDINCYDNSKVLNLGWLVSQLSRIINNNKKRKESNSIKHYVNKHGDVPIWVLIHYLDFGEMNTLLNNLPIKLKNLIAKNLCSFISESLSITQQFTPEIMESFTNNIREIRNVCAHNNRLLDFKCRASVKYYSDLHSVYNIVENDEKKDVYNTFIIMQCFLSQTQYATLHNTIRKRFCTLENRLHSISINDVLKSLGFPNDWHKTAPKLSQ
ncbi:Abi family protein [uncultured Vagococcus sp.]|uniref:Abi family protein n=1 Tax=uncultured Vagococcus sp. TaxID=189676 RepID=UPI0028D8433F|nr:Abi family protein [uncultured Vagococcus sp.]